VELSIVSDRRATIRQLQAISQFSRYIEPGKPGYNLQQMILGTGRTLNEPRRSWAQEAGKTRQTIMERYVKAVGPNKEQYEVIHAVVYQPVELVLLHGPPGTGKSLTNTVLAMLSAICNQDALLGAPSNRATEELVKKLVVERNRLIELEPNMAGKTSIVYFDKHSNTRVALLSPEPKEHDETSMSHHFHSLMFADANGITRNAKYDKQRDAQKWLRTYDQIQQGKEPSAAEVVNYLATYDENWSRIFRHPSVQQTVVSTAKNAWQLDHIETNFGFVAMDECASALEADTIIMATLCRHKLLLTGDHQQLRPVTRTRVLNEFYQFQQKSAFYRLYKRPEAGRPYPIIMLKINYRMHPRLSQFPAEAIYGWLGSAVNTRFDVHRAFEAIERYWNSTYCQKWRECRWPVPSNQQIVVGQGDCRRLFFNVKGSRSAPPPGSLSQRNFANINFIVKHVKNLLESGNIHPSAITIIVPYTEEKEELKRQLANRIPDDAWEEMVLSSFDGIQGAENRHVVASITPANEHHGSTIGFLREWSRMNVAITRAQEVLWLVGNMDKWMEELSIFAADTSISGASNFAMFLVDLQTLGDVVDIEEDWETNRLPRLPEQADLPPEKWSREIEHLPEPDEAELSDFRRQQRAEVNERRNFEAINTIEVELNRERLIWQAQEDAWMRENQQALNMFEHEIELAKIEEDKEKKAAKKSAEKGKGKANNPWLPSGKELSKANGKKGPQLGAEAVNLVEQLGIGGDVSDELEEGEVNEEKEEEEADEVEEIEDIFDPENPLGNGEPSDPYFVSDYMSCNNRAERWQCRLRWGYI